VAVVSHMASEELLEEYLGLLQATPEAAALRQIVELGIEVIGADEGSLLVMDADVGDLRFAMTVGESEKTLLGQRVHIGSGITGLAAATRQVQVGAPVYKDIEQTERLSEGPESVIAAPMLLGEVVVGVMTAVTFKKGRIFNSAEAILYARFARLAALLVEQTRRLKIRDTGSAPSRALGGVARLEQQLLARLQRIIAAQPSALGPLDRIIEAVEELAAGGGR
jgi:GAF domain-containing protein